MPDTVAEILKERSGTHGDFKDHAAIVIYMMEALWKSSNWQSLTPEMKEGLHMIIHKIGRIASGSPSHKDHWDDIAGYATLVSKSLSEEPETQQNKAKSLKGRRTMERPFVTGIQAERKPFPGEEDEGLTASEKAHNAAIRYTSECLGLDPEIGLIVKANKVKNDCAERDYHDGAWKLEEEDDTPVEPSYRVL